MKTNYLRNKLLEHKTGKTTYTKPSNTFIGLFTGDPTVDGDQNDEVDGGSYARDQAAWESATDGTIATSALIEFTSMPSCVVKYWGYFDASSNGNLLEYFPFEVPITVPSGEDFSVDAGNLILHES